MNHTLYVVFTTIHIVAATMWVGGLLFMSLILIPSLRKLNDPGLMSRLIQGVGQQYRWVGWISLLILVITGYLNLYYRGIKPDILFSNEFWSSPFGETLGWKLVVFAFVIFLSLIHDIIVGPRYRYYNKSTEHETQAFRYRAAASWIGRVTLILSLVIVALAVMMVRGRPW